MKQCILFAGVNGAGKTTLYEMADDSIKKMNRQEKAGNKSKERIMNFIEDGESYCQETALCGMDILEEIYTAKKENYQVKMIYVFVATVDIALDRVHKRISEGGHEVDDTLVVSRFEESIDNLKKLMCNNVLDEVVFIDNTNRMNKVAVYKDRKLETFIDEFPEVMKWLMVYKAE